MHIYLRWKMNNKLKWEYIKIAQSDLLNCPNPEVSNCLDIDKKGSCWKQHSYQHSVISATLLCYLEELEIKNCYLWNDVLDESSKQSEKWSLIHGRSTAGVILIQLTTVLDSTGYYGSPFCVVLSVFNKCQLKCFFFLCHLISLHIYFS